MTKACDYALFGQKVVLTNFSFQDNQLDVIPVSFVGHSTPVLRIKILFR